MLSAKLKEAAGNGIASTLYVDDVFSTYLYTGNGSTQTITNGIDLAGKGGLVWAKSRSGAYGHTLLDTIRGGNSRLSTNSTAAANTGGTTMISSFNSDGFTLTGSTTGEINDSGFTEASWTFRKAAKFFDVVTYTGTGANRTIAHNLGIAPGMVIVKRTDTTGNWQVYSNGLTSAAYSIQLNLTNAQASATTVWNSTAPTSSVFSVGTDATVNASGGTYVAYLFAHNTASDGIIQCGSFNSAGGQYTLGWEPQYFLIKRTDGVEDWQIYDTMRGWTTDGTGARLVPNTSAAESSGGIAIAPTATGFNAFSGASKTYIYMAIRRPNKPPTSGTQVFSPVLYSGIGTNNRPIVGTFPCDLFIDCNRTGALGPWFLDRLRSNAQLKSYDIAAENVNAAQIPSNTFNYDQTSILVSADEVNTSGRTYVNYFFKRAPGFFDVVCYTGNSVAGTTKAHNLTVVPEMMIVKARSTTTDWYVYVVNLGNTKTLYLDTTQTPNVVNSWNNTTPSSTVFTLGGAGEGTNTNTVTYVAYLFATLAGISKVGSYTGNGTTQTINCGFTGGARFVLIKRTDSTGDWYVFDTARGMTTLTDPYLLLNSTAAEVATLGAVTSVTTGFAVNAAIVAAINTNAASYIYLSIA